jgi:hypothetical protein
MKFHLRYVLLTICSAFSLAIFVACVGDCWKPGVDETDTSCCGATPATHPASADLRDRIVLADMPPGDYDPVRTKRCPCDTNLVQIDTSEWFGSEEEDAVARSSSKGEGDAVFLLPELDTLDRRFVAPRTLPQGTEPRPLKVAILDTGLFEDLLDDHEAEIVETRNFFNFSEDPVDVIDGHGHGSVVFSIIDRLVDGGRPSDNNVEYYIYKCLDDEGAGNAFTVACALKCAINAKVDIINASLGSYEDVQMIKQIIGDLKHPALIVSQGNDCVDVTTAGHYPSDYEKAYGIIGVEADCAETPIPDKYLWGCSNSSADDYGIAAPCLITSSDTVEKRGGTSFGAAYVSGRYADYLISHFLTGTPAGQASFGGRTPLDIFRDDFKVNPSETKKVKHFLHAVNDCVISYSMK